MKRVLPVLMMLLIALQSIVSASEWAVSAAHHDTSSQAQPAAAVIASPGHDGHADHAHSDPDAIDHHGLFDCHHANQCHSSLLAVLPTSLQAAAGRPINADFEFRSIHYSAPSSLPYRPPIV